jgi:hypothetical protein
MRIINPSFGLAEASDQSGDGQSEIRPTDWRTDPIALFSNSKPNTQEVLEGLKQHMGSFRDTDNIGFAYKDGAGRAAPVEVIDSVASQYRGAILALAD